MSAQSILKVRTEYNKTSVASSIGRDKEVHSVLQYSCRGHKNIAISDLFCIEEIKKKVHLL